MTASPIPATSSAPSRAVLSAEAVRVRRGRREVLHGVDLEVGPGEVVAIVGPNGAGKSTLLEVLGGVLPLSGGRVGRVGRVATVMQTPGLARRSVRANVRLALAWWGVPRGERSARCDQALRAMRADHLAARKAWTLSGGERRRVHLARGVALEADVLLLDEPFAGLDPESHDALVEDSAAALRSAATSVVIVLHERADAWALADRVVVLMDGRIVATGPPDALLAAPPSPEVARFLGYDGTLRGPDGVTLTRPSQVRIVDPAATSPSDAEDADRIDATVLRVVRGLDESRVDLDTGRGVLHALHAGSPPDVGQRTTVRVDGGVRFPEHPVERSAL